MKGKTIIMDSRTEEILKRCSSIEAIKGLSDEEKELLREQADKNDRMQCNNDFLGSNRNVKFLLSICQENWHVLEEPIYVQEDVIRQLAKRCLRRKGEIPRFSIPEN